MPSSRPGPPPRCSRAVSSKLGVAWFPTDYGMDVVRFGRAVEERGFESLFFPEHTRIIHSNQSANPVAALAAVAVATERIRLGTGNFDDIWQWPKPVQTPHPPVLVAGSGHGTIDRVLEYGDGWLPMPNRGPLALPDGLDQLRRRAEKGGRAEPHTGHRLWCRPQSTGHRGIRNPGRRPLPHQPAQLPLRCAFG
jgi:alkanesulfonate monooxygenase SsuD/methylene tetrahydromethanopterin reductase-like flavin-dependent oxidoreductase (luciferase family)